MAGGEGAEGALGVVFGVVHDKIRRDEVAFVRFAPAPVHEQADGPAVEHAVQPGALPRAQATAVVVARVQSGLDRPVAGAGREPLRR